MTIATICSWNRLHNMHDEWLWLRVIAIFVCFIRSKKCKMQQLSINYVICLKRTIIHMNIVLEWFFFIGATVKMCFLHEMLKITSIQQFVFMRFWDLIITIVICGWKMRNLNALTLSKQKLDFVLGNSDKGKNNR